MTGYQSKRAMARDKLDSMEREELKLALEKIERFITKRGYFDDFADEITAIKEALAQPSDSVEKPIDFELAYGEIYKDQRAALAKSLAQPAQEPVGFVDSKLNPIQRPWVEPTGNEWFDWWRVSPVANETEAEIDFADFLIIAQAVVAKLKDDNK